MKLATILRSTAAGAAIYVLMAACSASEHSDAKQAASSSSGSGQSSSGGGLSDVIAEALSPVSEASAAQPDVAVEDCSKSYTLGQSVYHYAEHTYPGVAATDLATVVVLATTNQNGPPGYTTTTLASVWIRDGAVAVICGADTSSLFTSATFVRPR